VVSASTFWVNVCNRLTLGVGIGSTARGAFDDPAAFPELGGNAQHGQHQLGEVGPGVHDRFGQ